MPDEDSPRAYAAATSIHAVLASVDSHPGHADTTTPPLANDTTPRVPGEDLVTCAKCPPHTPVRCRNIGDPSSFKSREQTQDSAVGHGEAIQVEKFEDDYLRPSDDYRSKMSDELWEKFKKDIDKCSSEVSMYAILAKFITRMCIEICQPTCDTDKCLAVFTSGVSGLAQKFNGSVLRPDVIMKWTTFKEAKEIAETGEPQDSDKINWTDIVSYLEVKHIRFPQKPPTAQASQYVHVLPRVQPNLAGMLYGVVTRRLLFLYWADASGIVRSHRYYFNKEDAPKKQDSCEEQSTWDILFRYILTLVKPLPDLPTLDRTMDHETGPDGKSIWNIDCESRLLKGCKLITATHGQSRQTCIFSNAAEECVVKDLWFDEERRFKESELLTKIKGVPAVVQVDFSVDVKNTVTNQPLKTSGLHSGPSSKIKKQAPQRMKTRSVLKSTGKNMDERKTVRQILTSIHDSLRGHQICVIHRRTLHRDVSKYNILIEPTHFVSINYLQFEEAKFLNFILDPNLYENKEDGILIDWDTAADLDRIVKEGGSLTNRTGTPIYVAIAVATGKVGGRVGKSVEREPFPCMEDEVRELYDRAFGSERYERYRKAVEDTSDMKRLREEVTMRHIPAYDVESFVWVLIHQLMLAWPENTPHMMNSIAAHHIDMLENHSFAAKGGDQRECIIRRLSKDDWEAILHPSLQCLVALLDSICAYFAVEWAHWPEINEDHAHEALAIFLLKMVHVLDKKGDPIRLKERPRPTVNDPDTVRPSAVGDTQEATSPRKRPTKDSQTGGRSSKKSKNLNNLA